MNSNIPGDILGATFEWFRRISSNPGLKDQNVQLGVHMEEFVEMLDELEGLNPEMTRLLQTARLSVHALAENLKHNSGEPLVIVNDQTNFLDSLCDQVVTATGVAQRMHYRFLGAMQEVNRSNYSKFDEEGLPYRDQNGKVVKGPNYSKANLEPFT